MASDEKCNRSATSLPSDYGQRAALAVTELIPAPHRGKAVQRLFDVSLRMAKYLLAGQHWTIDRLNQASKIIEGFDQFVASPEQMRGMRMELDELERRLARLEEERVAENARGKALQMVDLGIAGEGAAESAADRGMVRENAQKADSVRRQ